MLEDILVPLGFFAVIPLSIWAVTRYRYLSRAKMADMVQSIAQAGVPLDPELIKSISLPKKSRHADLRTGLIAIAIGIAFALVGGSIPDPEAGPVMTAIGAFPSLIGVALIGFWFFTGRKEA